MDNYVAYHSVELMGSDYKPTERFHFFSQKAERVLRGALGNRVWVVVGKRDGRRTTYRLAGVFTPTRIRRQSSGFGVIGSGTPFRPAVDVTARPWFRALLREQKNFSLGFNRIRSNNIVGELERYPAARENNGVDGVRFNPLVDRYDIGSAEALFGSLWPNRETRTAVAKTLAHSIRTAHAAGEACWTLSMFADYLRLNVGPVEALVLTAQEARFLFVEPLEIPPGFPEKTWPNAYRSLRVPHGSCIVPTERLSDLPDVLLHAHESFLRTAASRKGAPSGSWRQAFSPAILEYIERLLGESLPRPSYLAGHVAVRVIPLADEVDQTAPMYEGAGYPIVVNAYERNPAARKACIDKYGTKCSVCGFSFRETYGDAADGFIHVHHLRPLSEIGKEYKVDPVADLRPVCPNCHAVIHMRGAGLAAYTIAEVQALLRSKRSA